MNTNDFKFRHIGPNEDDQREMLDFLGVNNMDQLIEETIPDDIRLSTELDLDAPLSEQ